MMKLGSSSWLGFLATAGLLSQTALAASEVTMMTATSDAVEGTLTVKLALNDEGVVTALKYYAPSSMQTFDPKDLPGGIVLMKYGAYDVIKLYSSDFDARSGGSVTMNYLVNGFAGQRANYPLEVTREGADWKVYANLSSGRRQITAMYLKANRVFGQVVGISQVIAR